MALTGKPVFLDPGLLDFAEARAACEATGMRLMADRLGAEFFVVDDPTHVSQRLHWALAVGGGSAVHVEFICNSGVRGREHRVHGRRRDREGDLDPAGILHHHEARLAPNVKRRTR